MLKNDRYIGGGKLFFTPKGGTEVEIGEVQEAKLKFTPTIKEAFNKDKVMKTKVAKVVTELTAQITFTTQITNAHNTAMAMLGTSSNEVFATGATLPDGTIAAAETTIPVINAGMKPIIEGGLKFIGDEDGDTKAVLVIPSVSITPTSEIGYIVEDFTNLSFDGEVLKTVDGFAKEYRMAVA